MELYRKLPMHIVNIILEYSKLIKNRNGKYMNQIMNYEKYDIIKKVIEIKHKTLKKMMILNGCFYSDFFFTKTSIGIIHDYYFWENGFIIYVYKDKSHAFFYKWKSWIFRYVFGLNIEDDNLYSWIFRDVFGIDYNNYYYNIIRYQYR